MEATKVVLTYFLYLFCTTMAEKRILTNDPYYIHGIEAQFQALEIKVQGLESKNQAFQTKIQDLETKNQDLQTKVHGFESTLHGLSSIKGGDVYTRWGRNSCPINNTELVYSGYAGGSWYDHSGGAAEYVCLPKDPINHTYSNFTLNSLGFMYGAEYDGGSLQNQDVPCAVCRSTMYSSIVMIPARNQCYPGWVEQYHGLLSSGYYANAAATQYVCLDPEPEAVPHGQEDKNGKFFGKVTSKCGSLACPPYADNTVLSCVVCAK